MKQFIGITLFCVFFIFYSTQAPVQISVTDQPTLTNSASRLLMSNKKLIFAGCSQIDYNQPFGNESIQNGKLDVHRLVLLFAYNFHSKLTVVEDLNRNDVYNVANKI